MTPRIGKDATAEDCSPRKFFATCAVAACLLAATHAYVRSWWLVEIPQYGPVVEYRPTELSTYVGEAIQTKPSIILMGSSEQLIHSGSERGDYIVGRSGGDMLSDELARRLDIAGAPDHRPLIRFAAINQKPLEMLAMLGLWTQRAKAVPHVVIISIIPFPEPEENRGHIRPEMAAFLAKYPTERDATEATIKALPDGNSVAAQVFSSPLPPVSPASIAAQLETGLKNYFRDGGYFEASGPLKFASEHRYARSEDRLVSAIFARQQSGVAFMPKLDDPAAQELNGMALTVLVRWIKSQGITPVCVLAPWNWQVLHDSREVRETIEELASRTRIGGCVTIDATPLGADPANWGWAGLDRDFMHMTRRGIVSVAGLVHREGARLGAWKDVGDGAIPASVPLEVLPN